MTPVLAHPTPFRAGSPQSTATITELPPSPIRSEAPTPIPAVSARAARNRLPALALMGVGSAVGGAALATRLCLPAHPAKLLLGASFGARLMTAMARQQRGADPVPATNVTWAQLATLNAAFALSGAALAAAARLMLRLSPGQGLGSALVGVAFGLAPVLLGSPASPVQHGRFTTNLNQYAGHATALEGALRLPLAVATFCSIAVFPASGLIAIAAAGLGVAHTGAKVVSFVGQRSDDQDAPELAALRLQMPLAGAAFLGMLIGHRL